MILAGKVVSLLLIALFLPTMVINGFRGTDVLPGNVVCVAIGAVAFITLQWLL